MPDSPRHALVAALLLSAAGLAIAGNRAHGAQGPGGAGAKARAENSRTGGPKRGWALAVGVHRNGLSGVDDGPESAHAVAEVLRRSALYDRVWEMTPLAAGDSPTTAGVLSGIARLGSVHAETAFVYVAADAKCARTTSPVDQPPVEASVEGSITLADGVLPLVALNRALATVDAPHRLLVVDPCEVGVPRAENQWSYWGRPAWTARPQDPLLLLLARPALEMATAAPVSTTVSLTQALSGSADGVVAKDGWVSAEELFRYVWGDLQTTAATSDVKAGWYATDAFSPMEFSRMVFMEGPFPYRDVEWGSVDFPVAGVGADALAQTSRTPGVSAPAAPWVPRVCPPFPAEPRAGLAFDQIPRFLCDLHPPAPGSGIAGAMTDEAWASQLATLALPAQLKGDWFAEVYDRLNYVSSAARALAWEAYAAAAASPASPEEGAFAADRLRAMATTDGTCVDLDHDLVGRDACYQAWGPLRGWDVAIGRLSRAGRAAREKARPNPLALYQSALDALKADAAACPTLAPDATDELATVVEQIQLILDAKDVSSLRDIEPFVEDERVQLDAALHLAGCAAGTPLPNLDPPWR